MSVLPRRREPTHVVVLEVPVVSDEDPTVDVFQQAIQVALSASHAAFLGLICDDVRVSLRTPENDPSAPV